VSWVDGFCQRVGGVVVVVDDVETGHECDADKLKVRGDSRVGLRDDDVLATTRSAALLRVGPGGGYVHPVERPRGRGFKRWLRVDVAARREVREGSTRKHVGRIRALLGEEGSGQVRLGTDQVELLGQCIARGETGSRSRSVQHAIQEVEDQHLRVQGRQGRDTCSQVCESLLDHGPDDGRVLVGSQLKGEPPWHRVAAPGPRQR